MNSRGTFSVALALPLSTPPAMRLLDTMLKVPEETAETSTPTVQLAPAARAGKLGAKAVGKQ